MPEREVFGRCDTEGCHVIIESVLKYEGEKSWDIRVCADSPIIDEVLNHHLSTDITAQHNASVLFTNRTEAEENPINDESGLYVRKFPQAFGRLSVTRQRNYIFHCRRLP